MPSPEQVFANLVVTAPFTAITLYAIWVQYKDAKDRQNRADDERSTLLAHLLDNGDRITRVETQITSVLDQMKRNGNPH